MDLLRQNYFFARLFVFLLISSLIFPAQLASAETNVDDELPDLVVTSLYIGSDVPSPGEGIVIKATIANKGTIGAEDIGESIFVDGDHLISRGEYSLSAGASITREFEWVASEGSHAIKWMVDPEAQIQESNEDNNFRTIEIHVEDNKIPDLTITRVFVDKDVYEPGETVIIKAEVKNQGTGLAEGVRDVLIVDERIVSDSDAYQLEPGQIVTRQFRWEAVAGTHTLGVAVDPGNRIEELNEDNNEKFVSVKIRDEQRNSAEILSIETDKETYKRDDSVNIEYAFKNTGELRLHLRLAINIIGPDGRYVFDSIAGGEEGYFLSPGQHVSGRLSWTIPQDAPAGLYRVEAILVDGENREHVYDTKKGEYSPSFRVGVAFPIRLASLTSIGVENIGSISVSTVGILEFPARLSLAEGVYHIQAKAPEGYHFDHFSMRGGVSISTAARFTRMSTRPNRLTVWSTMFWTWSHLDTSTATVSTSELMSRTILNVSSEPMRLRSAIITLAPSWANRRAVARPMPVAPPARIATLPVSLSAIAGSSLERYGGISEAGSRGNYMLAREEPQAQLIIT